MKNMSSGFGGSSTRKISERERELDAFTDDFSPPGTADTVPGEDRSKSDNGYQDKHTDLKDPESFHKEFERRMRKMKD